MAIELRKGRAVGRVGHPRRSRGWWPEGGSRETNRTSLAGESRSLYGKPVSSSAIIQEIRELPPAEQLEVIRYAFELAKTRQLTADELAGLAEQLAAATDPVEIVRLRSAMTRGFYGE